MPWIYMFDESGADTKIGSAKDHYHKRFRNQQPCNPRQLFLRGAIWFGSDEAMKTCESELKKGNIFPHTDARFSRREWYRVGWTEALAHSIWRKFGGEPRPIEPFRGGFRDVLNSGDRGQDGTEYLLHAYVFAEEESNAYCKLRLSAYGWEAARQTYLTGNPHNIVVVDRWRWPDNIVARKAEEAILRASANAHIHFGWYRMEPAELIAMLKASGATPAPRRINDPSESDTTGGRIPLRRLGGE